MRSGAYLESLASPPNFTYNFMHHVTYSSVTFVPFCWPYGSVVYLITCLLFSFSLEQGCIATQNALGFPQVTHYNTKRYASGREQRCIITRNLLFFAMLPAWFHFPLSLQILQKQCWSRPEFCSSLLQKSHITWDLIKTGNPGHKLYSRLRLVAPESKTFQSYWVCLIFVLIFYFLAPFLVSVSCWLPQPSTPEFLSGHPHSLFWDPSVQ